MSNTAEAGAVGRGEIIRRSNVAALHVHKEDELAPWIVTFRFRADNRHYVDLQASDKRNSESVARQ